MRKAIAGAILLWLFIPSVSAAPLTIAERQRLIAHLEMTAAWLMDEVSGLSPAQLAFRRAPEAWTIMEVIDHLVVVGPIYWQDLQSALKAPGGRKTATTDADILWYGIDRTNREQAIPSEVPKGLRDLQAGLEAHRKLHARLLEYVRTTQDDLRSHVVDRQGSDAYQWALLISTHEQRHILQIREIKADPGFRQSSAPLLPSARCSDARSAMTSATNMPDWLEPMAATLTQERFSGRDWLFERKFDGIRLLAYKTRRRRPVVFTQPAAARSAGGGRGHRQSSCRRGDSRRRGDLGRPERLSRLRHSVVERTSRDGAAARRSTCAAAGAALRASDAARRAASTTRRRGSVPGARAGKA